MKNLLLSLFLIVSISGTSFAVCSGPLSGNYTIDPSSPITTTNYFSLNQIRGDLNSCGVSGPVVIRFAAGAFTGQTLFYSISGTSTTNTITIKGDPAGTTISHTGTYNSEHVILFNGTKHIILDSLTLIGSSPNYARVVEFDNSNENITVKNCTIKCSALLSSSTYNQHAIYAESNYLNVNKNIIIENNVLETGGRSIYLKGYNTSSLDSNIQIINNKIYDFHRIGIEARNQENLIIHNNEFISTQNPEDGLIGLFLQTGISVSITNNSLTTDGYFYNYGIQTHTLSGTVSKPSLIANNMIVTTEKKTPISQVGIYLYNPTHTNLYHNSVNIRAVGDDFNSSIYIQGYSSGGSVNVVNNLFVNSGKGLCVSYDNENNIGLIHNNAYYSEGDIIFKLSNNYYGSFAAYQAAFTLDSNSVFGYPHFLSDSNLHSNGNLLNDVGDTSKSSTIDIDGETRPISGSVIVDIGADEYTAPSCVVPYHISNFDRQINSHGVSWTLGNSETSWQVEYGLENFIKGTGSLSISSNDSLIINSLSSQTSYHYYVRAICGVGDSSDWVGPYQFRTACATQFNGVYTVNPSLSVSSTNYHTIKDILLELNDCGLSGPTTINVAAGTGPYVLDIELSDIPGNTIANSIVLNGNGVTINKGTTDFFMVLNGINNMTVNNFKFINQSTTVDMKGIVLRNSCDSIFIINNYMNVGMETNLDNSGCIIASYNKVDLTSNGENIDNLFVLNNELVGGYYSIILNGKGAHLRSENVTISNNIIRDFYQNGVTVNNIDNVLAKNNDINRENRPYPGGFYGIYLTSSDFPEIIGNKIHHSGSHFSRNYGIFLASGNNSMSKRGKIINNAIYEISSTYQYAGIFLSGSGNSYLDIHHNTIIYDYDRTSGFSDIYGLISYSYPIELDLRNNIISLTGAISGNTYGCYFQYNSATFTNDHNLIHVNSTSGTSYTGRYNSNASSIASWRTLTGEGVNSIDENPIVLANEYIPNQISINNLGDPSVSVTHDVDSNLRNIATPDFGAVEFTGFNGDISLDWIKLKEKNLCYNTNDSAFAQITNVFENTIDFSVNPITVNWELNGPISSTFSTTISTGTLAKGDSLIIKSGSANMSMEGTYLVSGHLLINSSNEKPFNDSLENTDSISKFYLFEVTPKTDTIISSNDSISIKLNSPFPRENVIFISEVSNYCLGSSGQPNGGRPSWLNYYGYIEITGPAGLDLEGITLEYWKYSYANFSYTFPSGTVIGPNGTALISTWGGTNSPANYYYTSSSVYSNSADATGRILKDTNGVIIDAVTTNSYVFPISSGVTSSIWSGTHSTDNGWGYRLEGEDNNSSSNWVASSVSVQDPGVVNQNITVPLLAQTGKLIWKELSANQIIDSNVTEIVAGPFNNNGTYSYEVTYETPCGTLKDTADIFVEIQTRDTLAPFSACDSFLSPYNGNIYTSNGLYSDTIFGLATGYDSIIVTYQLTIKLSSSVTISAVSCDSYISPSGKILISSNTYLDTIMNAAGCDSVLTINLTIKNSSDTSLFVTICDSMTSPTGKVWKSHGIYYDTLPASNGCDSILIYNVNVNYSSVNEIQKLIASERGVYDYLGSSVAISGNFAVVGARGKTDTVNSLLRAGAAFVYEKNGNGNWVEVQKLLPANRGEYDYFGSSVSIDGNYIVVANDLEDHNEFGLDSLTNAGSAYIFERNVVGVWTQVQKLVASDREKFAHFGSSVAIQGNNLAVGAYAESKDANGMDSIVGGATYMFKRNGAGVWEEVQKLVASDRGSGDRFGSNLSMDNNYLVIGASLEDEDTSNMNSLFSAGSAYVFERNAAGIWSETQKLVASDRGLSDNFGFATSISGNHIVIGALFEDDDTAGLNPLSSAGSAYVFERDNNKVWHQVQKIVAPTRAQNDGFGISTSIRGNYMAIGATGEDEDENGLNTLSSAGAVYIYKQNQFGTWENYKKLVPKDRDAGDQFGWSVAINENTILAGAHYEEHDTTGMNSINNAGSAYMFEFILRSFDSVTDTVCDEYITMSGNTFSSTGIHYDTLTNVDGCDSIIVYDLLIKKSTDSTLSPIVCDSYTSPSGKVWTSSANYLDTIPNAVGCDSLITINLTIRTKSSSIISPSVCDSYTSPSGKVLTTSNTYLDTIPNAAGCDSLMTINLTIKAKTSSTISADVCDNYTSPSGKVWTMSNTYLDTIPNAAGCDSLMTINLTIRTKTSSVISPSVCDSYTSPSGKVWTTSNTYLDTIPNATGCDSLMTINLTIRTKTSSVISPSVCDSYTSPSGKVWTMSNTYFDTIPNATGCDSLMTINLTIRTKTSSTISPDVCDSYTSPSGKIWTTSNTYLDTIPNAAGCDSLMTINLTIRTKSSYTISPDVCDSYTSPSGKVWTISNTYLDTILNAAGCDSLMTINLTIRTKTSSTISPSVCDSYSSPSGKVWTMSNTYLDTIPNAAGCDSLMTINLTIRTKTSSTISPSVCDSYTSPSGKVWTMSNTYLDTIPNAAGCDSLMTINLTIRTKTSSTISPNVCDSYTSPSGKVWTMSNTYLDTIPNVVGCDSLMTINLTIRTKTSSTISPIVCDSYTSPSGKVWTSSATYLDTIPNAAGCDSLMMINLTIRTKTSSTISPSVCDSYTSPSGKVWTMSNTYLDTIPNSAGCDSLMTINLTIRTKTSSTISPDVCDSYTSPSGKVWTMSNTYLDTIPNSAGCDSLMTINLTIRTKTSSTISPSVCDSYTSPSGKVWTSSATYLDTIPNASGCDSLMTINLTIRTKTSSVISPSVCDSYTSPSGKVWTSSAIYLDTIPNAAGCDSLMTINLTINNSTLDTISVSICDSYTLPGGIVISSSGTYTDTISTTAGCDSVIVVVLTVNNSSTSSISPTVCDSYISPSGLLWITSGTYSDTITNSTGCDSIISISLTINTVNAGTLSLSADSLICSATGVTYQWLDCNNAFAVISGETSQSFVPTINGDYACEVTSSAGCKDTTLCFTMNSVGLETKTKAIEWNLFPNPAITNVTVKIAGTNESGNIKIYSTTGQLVYEDRIGKGENEILIDVSNMASGVYTVIMQSGDLNSTKRLIIQ